MNQNSGDISGKPWYYRSRSLLITILLFASGMRFLGLGSKSLWVDEIIASFVAAGPELKPSNQTLSFIFWNRVGDVTPPLRDYIAHLSFRLLGVSEVSLRLFPVLFGILDIFLVYHVARRWLGDKIALMAALLLTISPYHLHHSQDGRMYTLLIFFTLAGMYCLYWAIFTEKHQFRYWLTFTITNIISCYLTYFGFWALFTQIAIGFIWTTWEGFERKKGQLWYLSNYGKLAICLSFLVNSYLPWIYPLWLFITKHWHAPIPYQAPFTASQITLEQANEFVYHLKPNWLFFHDLLTHFGAPGIGAYFYLFLAMLGLFGLWKLNNKLMAGFLLMLILPIIITFAPPAKELFFNRYIIFMMPVYIILVALGVWKSVECLELLLSRLESLPLQKEGIAVMLSAVVIVWNSLFIVQYYQTENQNWRDAVQYLDTHIQNKDLVVVGPYNAFWCVVYYSIQNGATRDQVRPGKPGEGEWCYVYFPDKTFAMGNKISQTRYLASLCTKFPRIWYISGYYRSYQYRSTTYYDLLESRFQLMKSFPGGNPDDNIYVSLYENPNVQMNPLILWPEVEK